MPHAKTIKRYKGTERRKHPRLDKAKGFIFYRLPNRNTEEMKEAIISDISESGLSFDTFEPIDPGAILECEIYQTIGKQRGIIVSIFTKALVVWIKETDNGTEFGSNRYRIRLRFIEKFNNF